MIDNNNLFRYTKKEYAETFIEKGLIFFNSLEYYKNYQSDKETIKDEKEGKIIFRPSDESGYKIHIGAPGLDRITLESGKDIVSGSVELSNTYEDIENFYIFCISQEFNKDLYEEFEADTCVKIKDKDEFIRRSANALKSLKYKLSYYPIKYYSEKEDNLETNLPYYLLKRSKYEHQKEFRLCFYKEYDCKQKKYNQEISFIDQDSQKRIIIQAHLKNLGIEVGSLKDITEIIER